MSTKTTDENLISNLEQRWNVLSNNRYCKENSPQSPYKFTHNVIIDEPGMGYCRPCTSIDEANREVAKLRAKGYRAIIKPIKPI